MKEVKNAYQTVKLSDGEFIQGLFPTREWYKAFSKHVDFKGKRVLDVGCNIFSYGVDALEEGAEFVTGIDNSSQACEEGRGVIEDNGISDRSNIIETCAEDFKITEEYNISIFSMIMHWMKDTETHVKRIFDATTDQVIFLYRYQQPGGNEPGYRPSVSELNKLVGMKPIHESTLLHTDTQYQKLVIYDKTV